MTNIAAIKTNNSTKALWFDANDLEIKPGQKCIVETSRGLEIGVLSQEIFEADDNQIKELNSELKQVKRIANDQDLVHEQEMEQLGKDAFPKFAEFAAETNEKMNPISVEYLFSGKKAVFYFSAPERQDFRDLVKKLTNEFHVRVDMRQISEREKSTLIGGIGLCGQELCCKRLGRCPKHVSIKMAKAQGLSLSPENISGMCGKLLCCLDYEFEEYNDFVSRAPKLKAKVLTPEGEAVVTDINMPFEKVEVKLIESEKRVKVLLSQMETDTKFAKENGNNTDNIRPNKIGKEAWEQAQAEVSSFNLESVYTTTNLQGSEKLATGVVKKLPSLKKRSTKTISADAEEKQNNRNRHNKNKHNSKKQNKKHGNFSKGNIYDSSSNTTQRRRTRTIGTATRPGQNSSGTKH